jgi:hypothetical protein
MAEGGEQPPYRPIYGERTDYENMNPRELADTLTGAILRSPGHRDLPPDTIRDGGIAVGLRALVDSESGVDPAVTRAYLIAAAAVHGFDVVPRQPDGTEGPAPAG